MLLISTFSNEPSLLNKSGYLPLLTSDLILSNLLEILFGPPNKLLSFIPFSAKYLLKKPALYVASILLVILLMYVSSLIA
nr:MAG: hypothetical protein [Bacteriophage sp.]